MNDLHVPDAVPGALHHHEHHVVIDGERLPVDTLTPSQAQLLGLVHKHLCGWRLVELLDSGNVELDPGDAVDLATRGLKGFITARPDTVEVYFGDDPFPIKRGLRTQDEILELVKRTAAAYILLKEVNGSMTPVAEGKPVEVEGCEHFGFQPKSGSTS